MTAQDMLSIRSAVQLLRVLASVRGAVGLVDAVAMLSAMANTNRQPHCGFPPKKNGCRGLAER